MGGDGSVAELCHAMVLRAQLDADSPVRPVKPALPLGIVPAGERSRGDATESVDVVGNVSKCFGVFPVSSGSTDVVSCSVHGVRDPVTAALHIILGNCRCVHNNSLK